MRRTARVGRVTLHRGRDVYWPGPKALPNSLRWWSCAAGRHVAIKFGPLNWHLTIAPREAP